MELKLNKKKDKVYKVEIIKHSIIYIHDTVGDQLLRLYYLVF